MKQTLPVIAAVAILAFTLISLISCGTTPETPAPPESESDITETEPAVEAEERAATGTPAPAVRVLAAGQQSAVRVPVARTVTNRMIFLDVWAAIHANQSPPPTPPEVDFERETVVVLVLGERRTGGYGVAVRQVTERRDTVTLTVGVISPVPDAMVTMALTSPYQIVSVPIVGKTFVFTGDDVRDGYSPYD